MNEIEKLKSHLKQAMEIANANIEKAENIDLEDMAQTLESFIDELDNIDHNQPIMFVPLAWNFYKEIRQRILNKRNVKEDRFLKYFPEVWVE